jgi:NtrC-family two-component system sensor histidine kinase KinB
VTASSGSAENHGLSEPEGRLAGVLAHQLGAGVAVIDACASMLRDADDAPDVVRALEAVGQRLRRVDENLNDLVRIARRRPSPTLQRPGDALGVARGELVAEAAHAGVEVRAAELPNVYADRTHLERLFVHLLGEVANEGATTIVVAAAAAPGETLLLVGDERWPIAGDEIASLLDRAPPQRLRVAGTSVALEVCRAIVERHGGRIGLRTTPERGLAVAFSLPDEAPQGSRR